MKDSEDALGDVGSEEIPVDVPDEFHVEDAGNDEHRREPSLVDDVVNLFEDGKTYLEAEAAFQKSRGGYIANRLKYAVGYAAAAFGVLHLALIALTVGVVLALIPIIGPWLATLLVGGVLMLFGIILLRALKRKVDDIRSVFDGAEP